MGDCFTYLYMGAPLKLIVKKYPQIFLLLHLLELMAINNKNRRMEWTE